MEQRRPDAGTWCEAWTVRDIVIHQAGNAEELARVLGAHLAGAPVGTRGFEEREAPLRALTNADLWTALTDRMAILTEVVAAADKLSPDTDVTWTGRTMKGPWFAEHMREELVLHGWDITGDDESARARLAEPGMTTHSVVAVGRPPLAKGVEGLRAGERIEARLRVSGTDDVVIDVQTDRSSIRMDAPVGPAILSAPDHRRAGILLWGSRPTNPSRICSRAGPEVLGRLRLLLSGFGGYWAATGGLLRLSSCYRRPRLAGSC